MNTAKKILISASIVCAAFAAGAQESKSELKARLLSSVKTCPNGDKVIDIKPCPKNLEKDFLEFHNITIFIWIPYVLHLESNPDLQDYKIKITADREAYYRVATFAYLKKSLKAKGKVGTAFSAKNAIKSIDAGIPPIVRLKKMPKEDELEIKERSIKRKGIDSIPKLKKFIGESETKPSRFLDGLGPSSFILGHNPNTKEFMIREIEAEPTWYTEKEVEAMLGEIIEIKIPGIN